MNENQDSETVIPNTAETALNSVDQVSDQQANPEADRIVNQEKVPEPESAGISESVSVDKIIEPQPPLPDFMIEDFNPALQAVILQQGWKSLLMVQKKAIPYILQAQDLIVQSKTGSGKTGAFVLPILNVIEKEHLAPQLLILAPTRELALQVYQETKKFGEPLGIRSVAVYGGVGYNDQKTALQQGVHIIVGTPGRILDHMLQGTIKLESIRDWVLDEADELLSMGFYPDMKRVAKFLPKQRCTYLFSATMPTSVRRLAAEFMNKPKFLSLCPGELSVSSMEHAYYLVDAMEKDKALVRIIETENPESALIFCNTKRDVNYLYEFLMGREFRVGILSGDVKQTQRQKMLADLKSGHINILVATDVAARGIDIHGLSHVFMYDHPQESEVYVHRAGRTARAGEFGIAISVVTHVEEIALKRTLDQYRIPITKKILPDDEQVGKLIRERAIVYLAQAHRNLKQSDKQGTQRMIPLLEELMNSEENKHVVAMLLHQFYWQRFVNRGEDPLKSKIIDPETDSSQNGGGKE